jgi:hypothetical protein|nr:MAG TPA: hypothetical protein [Caudoviricetes sp.]
MKTLKEEVIKMLMDRIGVAENEEFEARLVSEEYFNNKFYEGELLTKNSKGEWHDNSMWAVFIKYFDVYEFKVKPFKPVGGETYWIVTAGGMVLDKTFVNDNIFHCLNRAIGNCFRTKESALAHKEEILKILKGEGHE